MAITEAEAPVVLPLAHMKLELRIPDTETDHDTLLTSQIVSAVSHVSRRTGRDRRGLVATSGGGGCNRSSALRRLSRCNGAPGARGPDAAVRNRMSEVDHGEHTKRAPLPNLQPANSPGQVPEIPHGEYLWQRALR